eukprot:XP_001691623.1 gamma-glutamyl transpeptidase [Chlamydomonas reinhardtii]
MDVEASAEQPLLRGDEARKRPNSLRCGVVAWAVFAAVLVFLIVMTATFAGRGGGSSGSSSSGKPTFAVPPVGRYGVSWLYSPARAEVLAAEAAEPRIQPPLSYTLPGPVPYTLLVPPPPSSGPVLYLALSVLLGYLNSSSNGAATANATAAATAAWAAAMGGLPELATHRTVMADIADPAFAAELRAAINDSSVLDLANYGGRWNPKRTGVSPDDHGTSHLSVLDGEGNAVSLTTTVNTGFGSGLVSRHPADRDQGDTLEPFYDQLGDVQAILLDEQQPPAGGGGGGGGVAATAVSDPRKDGAPAAAG